MWLSITEIPHWLSQMGIEVTRSVCQGKGLVKKVMKGLRSRILLASHPTMPCPQIKWLPRTFFPRHSLPSSKKEWVGAMCGLFLVFASCSGIILPRDSTSEYFVVQDCGYLQMSLRSQGLWLSTHSPQLKSIFGRKDLEMNKDVWAHLKDKFIFQLHVHRPTLVWLSSLLRTFCHALNNKALEDSVGKHHSGTLTGFPVFLKYFSDSGRKWRRGTRLSITLGFLCSVRKRALLHALTSL